MSEEKKKGYSIGEMPATIEETWEQLFSTLGIINDYVVNALDFINEGDSEGAVKVLSQSVSFGLGGALGIAHRLKTLNLSHKEYVEALGREEIMKLPKGERDRILNRRLTLSPIEPPTESEEDMEELRRQIIEQHKDRTDWKEYREEAQSMEGTVGDGLEDE